MDNYFEADLTFLSQDAIENYSSFVSMDFPLYQPFKEQADSGMLHASPQHVVPSNCLFDWQFQHPHNLPSSQQRQEQQDYFSVPVFANDTPPQTPGSYLINNAFQQAVDERSHHGRTTNASPLTGSLLASPPPMQQCPLTPSFHESHTPLSFFPGHTYLHPGDLKHQPQKITTKQYHSSQLPALPSTLYPQPQTSSIPVLPSTSEHQTTHSTSNILEHSHKDNNHTQSITFKPPPTSPSITSLDSPSLPSTPKKIKRTRRRKIISPDERKRRKILFLERNRLAANKCRKKKKEGFAAVEGAYAEARKRNADLREELRGLMGEVVELRERFGRVTMENGEGVCGGMCLELEVKDDGEIGEEDIKMEFL